MSQQLFEVSGISLDNTISILYGVTPPGVAQDTIDAPQGSVYFDTNGVTWKKISTGAGVAAWSEAASSNSVVSGINSFRNVTGDTVADSLDATTIDTGVWAITTSSVANPLNHQTVIITGSHNTAIAKYSLYSRMDFGTKIAGITYDVRLNNGKFELVVFAPIFCNIDCYRLNAISNGSTVTLVASGGSGGGGTGDVTTAQLNAEIAARIAGDNTAQNAVSTVSTAVSTEVAARIAADAALDTKISGKADITGLATQFITINTNITTVSDALAAETAARVAADTALQNSINASVAGAITPAQLATAIASLPPDAAQVPSDWNATSGAAQILNKPTIPTIPTVVSAFTNDVAYQTATQVATAIAAIPAGGGSSSYNFSVDVLGLPVSNSLLGLYLSPVSFELSGTGVAKALVAATANSIFTLKKNGITLGTVTFAAGATVGVISVPTTAIIAGDELSLYAPVITDSTLSDIAITLTSSGASGGSSGTPASTPASGSSLSKKFTLVAHGFTVGSLLARIGTSWGLACADADINSEVLGVVSAVEVDSFDLTFSGYASGFTSLVDGTTYYLSNTTPGGYIAASPTAVGTVSKPIFVAISATEAIVIPSRGILN